MKSLLLAATLVVSATAQDTYVRLLSMQIGDTNSSTATISSNQLCQIFSVVSQDDHPTVSAYFSTGALALTKGDTVLGPAQIQVGQFWSGGAFPVSTAVVLKLTEVNVSPVPMAIQPAGFAVNAQMEWSGDLAHWFIGTNGPVDAAVTNRFYRVKLDLKTP